MRTKSGVAQLELFDAETAPEASKPFLQNVEKTYGFVPALYQVFAGAPAAIKSYLEISKNYSESSLSPQEQHAVLLAISVENKCPFCKAAHTWASTAVNTNESDINAIREGRDPEDPRLGAAARFARHLVKERGFASEQEVNAFLDAGFNRQQILEVVLGVTLKTLSNYTDHLADTPINEQLKKFA